MAFPLFISGLGLILLLFAGCTSKNSPQFDSPSIAQPADSSISIPKDTIPENEFPKLSDENAEEFLMEYFSEHPARKVKLETRLGTVKIRLYDDTPLHTANFLMMVERDYYDNTEFTRVVKNFVVQGGNNENETEEIKRLLIGNYEISPEFREEHLHKKGAIAMARRYTENEEKKSSAYYFYFIHGQKFNEPQLLAIEREHGISIPDWKREIYTSIGGAPHLDNEHTVFGEIYEGMDVLEKMANTPVDKSNWPIEPLIMKTEIINE